MQLRAHGLFCRGVWHLPLRWGRWVHRTLTKIDTEDLTAAIAHFDPIWDVLLPRERARIVRLLIKRVDYDGEEDTLGITFQPTGIKALVTEVTHSEDEAE